MPSPLLAADLSREVSPLPFSRPLEGRPVERRNSVNWQSTGQCVIALLPLAFQSFEVSGFRDANPLVSGHVDMRVLGQGGGERFLIDAA